MHMIATVHILLNVEGEGEAADALSGLLTECGIYEKDSGVVDWSYRRKASGGYQFAVPVDIPADYDRDAADLAAIAESGEASPTMRAVLAEALAAWPDSFDGGEADLNGGDLVEWFSGWRDRAKTALQSPARLALPIVSKAEAAELRSALVRNAGYCAGNSIKAGLAETEALLQRLDRADAISEAATRDDLDEACAIVQEAHGIESGDGAGYYFSGWRGDVWRDADTAARAWMLRDWLSIESVAT